VSEQASTLVQYVATLGALLTCTLVLAIVHNDNGATMALGGLLGFATGARPGASIPRPVATLGAIGLALGLGLAASGCTPAQGIVAAEMSCDVVNKVCALASGACHVLNPTSGGDAVPESE
jgi:hypothetical protein